MATQSLSRDRESFSPERAAVWRIIFLMAATVTIGVLVGTFSGEKLTFLYKEQLHLSASALSSLVILIAIPGYLRPFIGAWSDLFPIFGYHRRSYYALAALTNALGYFGLSLMPHYHYFTTALLVMVTIAGGTTIMIMADAVMVEIGNQTGTVGRIQAVQQFVPMVLSVAFAARLGGYVTQNWSYARCFETAALISLIALPLTLLIPERRQYKTPQETTEERAARAIAKQAERAQTIASLREAAKSRSLWAVLLFIFYLILTPGNGTAQLYYEVDHLHFSKQFIGNLGQPGAVGAMLGILTFAAISRRLPARALVWSVYFIGCLGYLLALGLRDQKSAEIITFVGSFFGIMSSLGIYTIAARACPPGIEGTIYGLFMSAITLGSTFSDKFGSLLYDNFGPTNKAHHYTTTHGWFASLWIGLAFTVLAALFIPFLPAWAKSSQPLRIIETPETS